MNSETEEADLQSRRKMTFNAGERCYTRAEGEQVVELLEKGYLDHPLVQRMGKLSNNMQRNIVFAKAMTVASPLNATPFFDEASLKAMMQENHSNHG